jgi:nucleoside-diphosphate-sugar epimerase
MLKFIVGTISEFSEQIIKKARSESMENDKSMDKKCRVLVTGASGWLGQFLWLALHPDQQDSRLEVIRNDEKERQLTLPTLHFDYDKLDIHGIYFSKEPYWIPRSNAHKVDLRDDARLQEILELVKPHCIIHLAAISSPAACHQNPADAEAMNNPSNFIKIVKKVVPNCVFVYSSTGLVYDGNHAPYDPINPFKLPEPTTVYGRSKINLEPHVLSLRNGIILRLCNMVGPPFIYTFSGAKFLQFLYEAFARREYLGLRYDEIRSFVYIGDVVYILLKCVELTCKNLFRNGEMFDPNDLLDNYTNRIYNVGGPDGLSRLDMASLLVGCKNMKLYITNRDEIEGIHVLFIYSF